VVSVHKSIECRLGGVREYVLAGPAGEPVGLTLGVELRRVHEQQLREPEVLYRPRDGAHVTRCLCVDHRDGNVGRLLSVLVAHRCL